MSGEGTTLARPAYPIESVDNALTLLAMFGDGQPVRVSDASATIGVARSTAHRLLAMLQYHGFVKQDPVTRAYVAGPALLQTGLRAVRKIDVRNQARPFIEALSRGTGETVHLVSLQGAEVLFLDSVESTRAVRVASRVGEMMPAHCTSAGKAVLAQLSPEELDELFPDAGLRRLTDNSIGTRLELEAELERIRKRGYATSGQEAEVGVGSVGVAIPVPAGRPKASLSVSAPVERLTKSVREELAQQALAIVRQIGDVLH